MYVVIMYLVLAALYCIFCNLSMNILLESHKNYATKCSDTIDYTHETVGSNYVKELYKWIYYIKFRQIKVLKTQ